MRPEVITGSGDLSLAEKAASLIAGFIREDVSARNRSTLVLSGGKTPEPTYEKLGGLEDIPWEEVYLFWGDERMVPKGHPERNSTMVERSLLRRAPVPSARLFTVPDGCSSAAECARLYERTLKNFFPPDAVWPLFDTVLLGVGDDGHTAALYPGGGGMSPDETRWAIDVEAPERYAIRHRITLTLPVLNSARRVVFLVSGEGKRDILGKAFPPSRPSPPDLPACLLSPRETLLLLTDVEIPGF
jgi:6-phosphogluconolactonase